MLNHTWSTQHVQTVKIIGVQNKFWQTVDMLSPSTVFAAHCTTFVYQCFFFVLQTLYRLLVQGTLEKHTHKHINTFSSRGGPRQSDRHAQASLPIFPALQAMGYLLPLAGDVWLFRFSERWGNLEIGTCTQMTKDMILSESFPSN